MATLLLFMVSRVWRVSSVKKVSGIHACIWFQDIWLLCGWVSRVSSVSRVSTVTMLLRESVPGLNFPLYYFSGFQVFREFLVFQVFQRSRGYTLLQGLKIFFIFDGSLHLKFFEGS